MDHRSLNDPVGGEDRHFRKVDDRRRRHPAQRAEAGEGDGRAGQVLALDRARPRLLGKPLEFARAIPQVARLGVPHDRNHQPRGRVGGDADVHGVVAAEDAGLVVVERVDVGEGPHGPHHGQHQERQQGETRALRILLAVERLPQALELGQVEFLHIAEVGNGALGLLHAFGDQPAQADDADLLHAIRRTVLRGLNGANLPADVALEVGRRDPSVRTGAFDLLKRHARGRRSGAGRRGRQHARRTGGLGNRRGGRRGRARRGFGFGFGNGALGLELRQGRADGQHLADRAVDRDHAAGNRRGHLHRRLVGQHVHQGLLLGDLVPDLHVPGRDFGLGYALADVGQAEDVAGSGHLSPP